MSQPVATIAVDLGQEEAWTLLYMLRIGALPGLKPPDESPERLEAIYQAGERSLRARGLIQSRLDDQQQTVLGLTREVMALVAGCALAQRVLSLSYEFSPDLIDVRRIYFIPELRILHYLPEPGIHRFLGLASGAMLLDAIISALRLGGTSKPPAEYTVRLDRRIFEAASASGSAKAATVILLDAGQDETLATTLGELLALHAPVGRALMTDVRTGDSSGLSFLAAPNGYWVVVNDGDSIELHAAIASDITGWVTEQILRDYNLPKPM